MGEERREIMGEKREREGGRQEEYGRETQSEVDKSEKKPRWSRSSGKERHGLQEQEKEEGPDKVIRVRVRGRPND